MEILNNEDHILLNIDNNILKTSKRFVDKVNNFGFEIKLENIHSLTLLKDLITFLNEVDPHSPKFQDSFDSLGGKFGLDTKIWCECKFGLTCSIADLENKKDKTLKETVELSCHDVENGRCGSPCYCMWGKNIPCPEVKFSALQEDSDKDSNYFNSETSDTDSYSSYESSDNSNDVKLKQINQKLKKLRKLKKIKAPLIFDLDL